MAKKGPRSYPNTFWMILGTSKISLNLGPIIGHFWARGPRIYGFSYTKNTSKNIRKYMGTSWKNIIFPCLTNKIFENFRKANPPFFWIHFLIYIFCIYFVYILYIFFEYVCSKYFYEDDERAIIIFPLISKRKSWMWISFVSKNMNRILP